MGKVCVPAPKVRRWLPAAFVSEVTTSVYVPAASIERLMIALGAPPSSSSHSISSWLNEPSAPVLTSMMSTVKGSSLKRSLQETPLQPPHGEGWRRMALTTTKYSPAASVTVFCTLVVSTAPMQATGVDPPPVMSMAFAWTPVE